MTNPLDYKSVTNMYLYGTTTTPSNKATDTLIRPSNVTTLLSFSQAEVMASVGRFAVGAQFGLVSSFFQDSSLLAGTYTKAQLGARYTQLEGRYAFSMQQKDFADGTDDYAQRVFIWNSMNFKINDDAVFTVAANGTKSISNYSVQAVEQIKATSPRENFDFQSVEDFSISSWLNARGNDMLKEWIDPSEIGRKVLLNFTGTMPTYTYTQDIYFNDVNKIASWRNPTLVELEAAMHDIADKLFFQPEGVTKYLTSQGKPIFYGTVQGDSLMEASLPQDHSLLASSYLEPFMGNGVVLIGGKGNDRLIGGSNNDSLMGGDENDSIFGGAGSDTLRGEDGNDVLEGESDADTLDGGAGNDTLSGGFDKSDTYILSSGNADAINDSGAGDVIWENADGKIFAGEAVEQGEDTGIYSLHGAQLQNVGGDLIITRGADVTYVWGWVDGDYGITLEEKDKPDDDVQTAVENLPRTSPIALDINKSGGINTVGVTASTTYFDIDNDNFKERVEWLTGGDGWLARDANNNGKIDNQNELFGDGGDVKAYQKLAALNTNNTGTSANLINSADSAWNSLRVWIDGNANGVSEAAEIKTLASLGITSLSLETAVGSLRSTFVMNGTSYHAQDIFVATDQVDSWYKGTASEITPLSLTLPRSRGYGDVKSLHYAASSSSTLTSKLQELDNLPLSGLDSYYSKLEAMVEEWTGAHLVAMNPSSFLNARHYFSMEQFSGIKTGTAPWLLDNIVRVENGYNTMMNELSARIIAQGALANVFGNPTYSFSDDGLKFSLSHTQILANAKANVPTDAQDINVYWSEVARTLLEYATEFGTTATAMQTVVNNVAGYNVRINAPWYSALNGGIGNDSIVGDSSNNLISAEAGNDTIWGWTGNDYILGEAGNDLIGGDQDNDTLIGGEGNDTLFGWTGNDSIHGGAGDDVMNGDDGNDTIFSGGGNDVIYGGNGNDVLKSHDDVGGTGTTIFRYARGDGDDVIKKASTATTNDVLELTNIARSEVTFSIVNNYSAALLNDPNSLKITINGGGSILLEKYFDGTNAGRIASIKFSDGVLSTMNGTSANDTIWGGSGKDLILGEAGNDFIGGNQDNDIVAGGEGHDTLFGWTGDDNIHGETGGDVLSGEDGNDSLYGGAGADSLRGGLGNDSLYGGEDSDTYFYAKGDGNDVLVDFVYSALQGILRLENITRSEVSFVSIDTNADGAADSIRLNINGGGSITLQDQLNALGTVDFFNVVFSDGITMNAAQIKTTIPILGTSGNDTLFGDNANNNISGMGGNDQISGNAGNDSLSGDAGNDTMWGNDGNDVIIGGDGLDHLIGGMGADNLNGGIENDSLWADDGNDTLTGGVGVDYLVGGNGADRFVFNKGDTGIGTNGDNIGDFNRSQGDKIALLGYGLNASGFRGTGAMAAGGAVEFNYTKVAAYNYTMIRIDADNNGVSDQEIWLTGVQIDLVASDFVFV